MKWIKEPIPGTCYCDIMLALEKSEVKLLANILKKPLNEWRKRMDRLNDVHESGEATVRQENARMYAEEKVSLMKQIVSETECLK